eukprot:s282_g41.t2
MERRPIFSYPKPFLFGSNMTKTDGKGVHAPDAEAEATAAALRRLAATHAAQQAERSMRQEELQQHLEEAQERLRICREMQHSEAHQALHRYRQDESEVERLQLEMAQASAGSLEAPEAAPMPVLPSEELPHGVSMVGPVVSNSCAVTGSPSSSPRSSDCRERFPVWAQAAPVPKLEQKEIQLFYSQVHPLQQGVRLRAATSPQQNFEEKTLVLSSDFQRLELWPSTVRGPARRRIADSFLRLEALSRVHLPGAFAQSGEAPPSKPRAPWAIDLLIETSHPWRLRTKAFELEVACLSSEGFSLTVDPAMLGREVYQQICQKLPRRAGARLHLTFGQYFDASLVGVTLPSSLQTLTFGYHFRQSLRNVVLPCHLQSLSFGFQYDASLQDVNLPSLQQLTFGGSFNQNLGVQYSVFLTSITTFNRNLDNVILPTTLRNLTFGRKFNQSLADVNLPESLCALNFGKLFNQSLEKVALPCNLQQLAFVADSCFDQSLENVILPKNLQTFSLGTAYSQNFTFPPNLQSLTLGTKLAESTACLPQLAELASLTLHTSVSDEALPGERRCRVMLPESLQTLTFGGGFNQSLEGLRLPEHLRSLTFGCKENESLETITLPESLESLTFSGSFNRSIDNVTLPSNLQSLTFGRNFNQNMDNVIFPLRLQSVIFGRLFNQSLEHVTFPPNLKSLTLATDYAPSLQGFNQSLEGVTFPSSLQTLTLGYHFNQSLEGVVFPEHLESLTFGHLFNQSLEGVRFPESLQTLKFGDSFQHSLKDVLPCNLRNLSLGLHGRASLKGVTLPSTLQTLLHQGVFLSCAGCENMEEKLDELRRWVATSSPAKLLEDCTEGFKAHQAKSFDVYAVKPYVTFIGVDERSFREVTTAVKTLMTFRSKVPELALADPNRETSSRVRSTDKKRSGPSSDEPVGYQIIHDLGSVLRVWHQGVEF